MAAYSRDAEASDQNWGMMFQAEQALLYSRKHNTRPEPNGSDERRYLTGIGLSGGGIRSATVSLGMLQTLAGARILRHVDYLSSVSGGGYTAAATAFRYARGPADADPDEAFPFGSEDPAPEPGRPRARRRNDLLAFLRNHANYLTPAGVADVSTGSIAVARSLLLNIFLWVMLGGVVLFAAMTSATALMEWRVADQVPAGKAPNPACVILASQCWGNSFFDAMLFTAAMLALAVAGLMVAFSLSSWRLSSTNDRALVRTPPWVHGLLWLVLMGVAFLWALHAIGHLDQWGAIVFSGAPLIWGEHVVPLALLVLISLFFAGVAFGPLWFRDDPLSRKYARRRYQENLAGRAVIVMLGLTLVGLLPDIRNVLARIPLLEGLAGSEGRGPLAAVVYLVSLGAALYGYYRSHLQGRLGLGSSCLIVAGSCFLIFGALLLSYEVAVALQRLLHNGWPVRFADAFTLAAPFVALALGFFVNINDVGLGRYYRDRLMEAFMPEPAAVERERQQETEPVDHVETAAAPTADRFRLRDVLHPAGEAGGASTIVGPYPLINANVMTRAFGDRVARRRGGDSFVLAPAWSGSTATGWQETATMIDGRMPLSTAMAISGAAANPRGGFVGSGPTTNPVVAFAMSLLAIRLGYWLRWTCGAAPQQWLNPNGNHFVPVASDLLRYPGAFVELTDGGHFENLGLYELVRRRCGLIIICDGGDDRQASYASFVAAADRIEEDLGATFGFDIDLVGRDAKECFGPAALVARPTDDEYPKDAEYAKRGYFLATVHYGVGERRVPMAERGPETGLVIYLKSAMIPALDIVTRGYKGANADFPYESTADQFFSPEQFEAYRDVGVAITRQMLAETGLADLFRDGRPKLDALTSNARFHVPPRTRAPEQRPSA